MSSEHVESVSFKGALFNLLIRITRALSGKQLTRIPGLSYLYDKIYDTLVPGGVIFIECQGSRMYVNTDDRGLVPFLVKGTYEEVGTKLFKELVKPGMIVIDIGANVGYYTLMAAKIMEGKGKVYSFEPVPSNYDLLVENIRANGYKNVFPVKKALAGKTGETKLHIDRTNFGGHSISGENVPVTDGTIEAETTTLDRYLEREAPEGRVDLIKTDAQGAEGLIFDGASRTIEENAMRIVMEFWPFGLENVGTDPLELLQRLNGFGFEIKTIEENGSLLPCRDLTDIIERCGRIRNGRGDLLLLLEKDRPNRQGSFHPPRG